MFQFRRAALRALRSPSPAISSPNASRSFVTRCSAPYVSSHADAFHSLRCPQRLTSLQFLPRRTYATEDGKGSSSAIDSAKEAASDAIDSAREVASNAAARVSDAAADASESLADTQGSKVYVGNIFFDTSEEMLRNSFEATGPVEEVKIIRDGRGMSKGFAYVTFKNQDDVQKAIDQHNRTILDGRTIVVNHAIKSTPRYGAQQNFKNPPARTLFIGNMSYEMTDKDLNDLFRQVKNVLDVRVAIDRRTGQPRGFAHADFVDVKSAEEAAEWLKDQTFYNRRLRIDYTSWQNGRKRTDDQTTPEF